MMKENTLKQMNVGRTLDSSKVKYKLFFPWKIKLIFFWKNKLH